MRQFISRILLAVFAVQMAAGPLFGQDYRRQFSQPLSDDRSSGMSFRKSDIQEMQQMMGGGAMQEGDIRTKGMMMTEPSMSGLTYQVHVLGEVKNPGTYRITASDRLSEVLLRAGGVDEQGSERKIEVRRRGEPIGKYDLLSFKIFGDLADNPYLLDNDVVYIPIRGSTVSIVGAVMRPREYELKNEKTLADAVKLAGGFSVGAAKDSPIRVVRFVKEKKEVMEVRPDDSALSAFDIQNGDVIFIPHVITERNQFDFDLPKLPGDNIFYPSFEDRVFVLGGVQTPGAYTFNPYYTLPQYLSLAGGTTKLATNKINVLSPDGEIKKVTKKNRTSIIINPGDTVVIGERRIPPEGWVTLFMSIATFGLATTSTVLALTK